MLKIVNQALNSTTGTEIAKSQLWNETGAMISQVRFMNKKLINVKKSAQQILNLESLHCNFFRDSITAIKDHKECAQTNE